MGGSKHPPGSPPHRPQNNFTSVSAQKNINRATYQTPVRALFRPDFRQLPYGRVHYRDVRHVPVVGSLSGYNYSPETNSYALPLEYFMPFPNIDGSSSVALLSTSPPKPASEFSVISDSSIGFNSSFHHVSLHNQFHQQYLTPKVLSNGCLPGHNRIPSTQQLPPASLPPYVYNPGNVAPYFMVHTEGPEVGYSQTNGNAHLGDSHNTYNSETNGFHLEHCGSACGHEVSSQMTYPHVPHKSDQDSFSPGVYAGSGFPSPGHSQLHRNQLHLSKSVSPVDRKMSAVEEAAHSFVDSFCPLLGERPYCLPPIKRSRHPDKSMKQLAVGMESEKRVLGSFERFFAEQQIPVLMLCHYPMSGFMHVYNRETSSPIREFSTSHSRKRGDTLTLMLLSDVFAVMIVTVSIIGSNSDFAYIQRGVQNAASHIKKCSATVARWLTFLGVIPKVRQVIAFPNLKKAMMQRVTKEKQFQQNFGSLCTLNVDDLSAPFEEEWSTPVYKHLFSEWMQTNVMCHSPTLTREELHLVVGALLSPRLSQVDFVQDKIQILPISESTRHTDTKETITEDVSQLKLTIDGVTKPFDDFMDEYVACYYPNVEEVTYRVPPINFNIQSLKKSAEYLQSTKSNSPMGKISLAASETCKNGTCENQNSKVSVEENSGNENNIGSRSEGRIKNTISSECMQPSSPDKASTSRHGGCNGQAGLEELSVLFENVHDPVVHDPVLHDPVLRRLEVSSPVMNDVVKSLTIRIQDDSQDSSESSIQNQTSASVIQLNQNPGSKSSVTTPGSSPTFSISLSQSSNSSSSNRVKLSNEQPPQNRPVPSTLLEALQDVDILSAVMTKDVRADEGENRVIGALEKLGHQFGPMFIICDYQYNNYLNKLREEMFSKRETRRPIRAFGQTLRAEHDCLILHKKYGAIVVCIKAIGDNFNDWGASEEQKLISTSKILEKVVKQVEREEKMLRHVTSDLHPKLTCHRLMALPNMTRGNVERALDRDNKLKKKIRETFGHGAELFLCSDELPPKFQSVWDHEGQSVSNKLVNWWQQIERQFKSQGSEMTSKVYRQIIGRYCGLLSTVEVWSPTSPRVEVRNMSQAVHLCAERFHKMVLLPCQLDALCSGDRRVFLCGPPGCGKTLVLTLKAREWLLAGETVILVNARPGSPLGYPYAYGVLKRLQQMMMKSKVQNFKLFMIRLDSLQFRADDLAGVMPSCCIIMDEVSASCHEIIEHFSCLQVKYIWCAGLFEEDKPITAHRFTTHKMDKIIRCPPVIQSIMKHTEEEVKLQTPYGDMYQSSVLGRICPVVRRKNDSVSSNDSENSDKENRYFSSAEPEFRKVHLLAESTGVLLHEQGEMNFSAKKNSSACLSNGTQINEHLTEQIDFPEKQSMKRESKTEDLKYDAEALNKRLAEKYGRMSEKCEEPQSSSPLRTIDPSCYCTSSAETGLPTDGPRPHIIDHRSHSQPGDPSDCFTCGQKVAKFLEGMVRPEDMPAAYSRHQPQSKNKHAFKSTGSDGSRPQSTKTSDSNLFSITSSLHTKSLSFASNRKLLDSRALTWSDVLIAAKEMPKNCAFVAGLRSRNVPVEVIMSGETFQIEDTKERKVFITQYKEMTGLERAVIVFVPSSAPDQLQETMNTSDLLDIQLGNSISRFTAEDRMALWHVASRSLSSLILILP